MDNKAILALAAFALILACSIGIYVFILSGEETVATHKSSSSTGPVGQLLSYFVPEEPSNLEVATSAELGEESAAQDSALSWEENFPSTEPGAGPSTGQDACTQIGLSSSNCIDDGKTVLLFAIDGEDVTMKNVSFFVSEDGGSVDSSSLKRRNLQLRNVSDLVVKDVKFLGEGGEIVIKELPFDVVHGDESIAPAFRIAQNNLAVDSSNYPELDQPAHLKFKYVYGFPGAYPLRNGEPCGAYCSNFKYDASTGTASMDVSGFSNYSIGGINVSKAEHLDSSYGFVSDITDEVKDQDGVWSEHISDGHFVRATFAENLTNGKTIDTYARGGGNIHFEIYAANTTSPVLGVSEPLNSSGGWQYITLENLSGETDTFDFKIIGDFWDFFDYAEFDYIHDATNINACTNINTPGEYVFSANIVGRGSTISGITGTTYGCIQILTSNVTVDCNGYTLYYGTSSVASSGIAVNGSSSSPRTNITIKNCPDINRYGRGIILQYVNQSTVQNVSARAYGGGGFQPGLYMINSSFNNISRSTFYRYGSNTLGVYAYNSNNNTFISNTAYNNNYGGFALYSSSGNTLLNNTAYSNSYANYGGFYLTNSSSNTLINNSAYSNSDGIHLGSTSDNNTIFNNSATGNSYEGIYLSGSSNNAIANNTATGNTARGLYLYTGSNNNTVANNSFTGNSQPGVYIVSSGYNNITNNNVSGNYNDGISLESSFNNSFTDNSVNENYYEGIKAYSSPNNTFANNNASANRKNYGIILSSSPGTTIVNNTIQENPTWDIWIDSPSTGEECNNIIENNTVSGGRPLLYSNESPDWEDTEASEVILCGSDGAYIRNVTVSGSDTLGNNGIAVLLSANAQVLNSSSTFNYEGLYISGTSYSNFSGNTLGNNTDTGIFAHMGSGNNTFTRNAVFNNSVGAYLEYCYENTFADNNISNSTYHGITVSYSSNNSFMGNNILNSTQYGAYIQSSFDNNFTDNTAFGNNIGAYLESSQGNNLSGNNLSENTQYDFYVSVVAEEECNNIVEDNTGSGGRPILYSNESPDWEDMEASEVFLCGTDGAYIENVNILGSDTLYNNGMFGMMASNSQILNSNSTSNGGGFYLYFGSGNNLTNNFASNNSESGIAMESSDYGILTGNNATGNSYAGISVGSSYSLLENNSASGNGMAGFSITKCSDNNLTNNTAFNNLENGIGMYMASTIAIANCTMYGNGYDFYPSSSSFTMETSYFLNPYGTLENYTVLAIADSQGSGEDYSINWTQNSEALPYSETSFANKWVNISYQNNLPSIDSITWHWSESELNSSYNESKFELWKYGSSGTWSLINGSPDTTANILSAYALDPASDYGILQTNASENCPIINESGYYVQDRDYTGSPNYAAELDMQTCVHIVAPDVVFDCNGRTITSDSTFDDFGIFMNGSATNVTILNCPGISAYGGAVCMYGASGNAVYDSTFHDNSVGAYIEASENNTFSGITAYSNQNGLLFQSSSGNNVTGSNASENYNYGFYISGGSGNLVSGNNFTWNDVAGAYIDSDSGNAFIGNNLSNNQQYGAYISSNTGDSFEGNEISNNGQYGAYLSGSSGNNFTGNNISTNGFTGAYLDGSTGNSFINNSLPGHSSDFTFYLGSSSGNTLSGNNASGNYGGIYASSSPYNIISENDFSGTGWRGAWFVFSSFNNVTGNNFSGSSGLAVYIESTSTDNSLIGNDASNSDSGFYIELSSGMNNITNNTASGNTNFGIYINSCDSNAVTGNNLSNNEYGIQIFSSPTTTISGNAAYGNTYGFSVITDSKYTSFTNNTAYNNGFGFYFDSGVDLSLANCTTYNNGYDFYAYMSNFAMERSYFLNPAGTMENYSVISITDVQDSGDDYFVNWTQNSETLPYGHRTFANKWVNISYASSAPSIDTITWHWEDSEISGYNESRFELWGYSSSGGWSMLSDTPDTGANTFTIYGLAPSSDYGILESNQSQNCPVINASGTYVQDRNYEGAPRNSSEAYSDGYSCVKITASDVTFDCNGYSITGNGAPGDTQLGIHLNGSLTNVTVKNCVISNYTTGLIAYYANHSTFENITAYNNNETGAGIFLLYPYNSTVSNSAAYSSGDGIVIYEGAQSTVRNNIAHNNSLFGISISGSNYTNIINNSAYGNSQSGFHLESGSNNNIIRNNTAYGNTENGFYLYSSPSNTLINNTAFGNTQAGFYLSTDSGYNGLAGNNATGNAYAGFQLESSDHTDLENCSSSGSGFGMFVYDSNYTNITNAHLYGNGFGLFVQSDYLDYEIYATNMTMDSASGSMEDYTSLSLSDIFSSGELYVINWTGPSSAPPEGHPSFRQKFVNISAISGTPLIDEITWHWEDSEVPGHDESKFELWKFNSSGEWELLNNTPDTGANTLTLYGMNPASEYGILENNASACGIISAAGEYLLANAIEGAPVPVSDDSDYADWACVVISVSNVTFDCNGYGITNNGTEKAAGIFINGSGSIGLENVTLQNCPSIYNYSVGAYAHYSSDGAIRGIMADADYDSSTTAGIVAYNSDRNYLEGLEVSNHTYGIILSDSDFCTVANNTASSFPENGVYLDSSTHNNLTNNTVYDTVGSCIYLSTSSYNNLVNNTAHDSSYVLAAGIQLSDSGRNNLSGNIVYGNTVGIDAGGAAIANYILDNTAYDNTYGIQLYSNAIASGNTLFQNSYGAVVIDENNTLSGNNMTDNTYEGIWLQSASGNNISDNIVYANHRHGISVSLESYSNILVNNTVYSNSLHGMMVSNSPDNALINNTAYSNTMIGIVVSNGSNTNITGDAVYNNYWGIVHTGSDGIEISNCSVYGNSVGIGIQNSNGSTISASRAYNNEHGFVINMTSTSGTLSVSGLLFLNQSGTLEDYVNISLSDSLGAGESYSINWTSEPATPPEHYSSFSQKYAEISSFSGSVSIDTVVFHWDDSETGGYNPPMFTLWKHNSTSGWTMLNDTPDISGNTLSLYDLVPASDYGILEFEPEGACFVANTPNTYYSVTGNLVGAPNSAYPAFGASACIVMAAPNITVDCNGYSIINNGTADAYGVFFNSSATNATLLNCSEISGYDYGLGFYGNLLASAGNAVAQDVFLNNNTYYGAYLYYAENVTIRDSAINGSTRGVYLYTTADRNFILNNSFTYVDYGIYTEFNVNNTFENNTMDSPAYAGIYAEEAHETHFIGNTINFTGNGIESKLSNWSIFSGNNISEITDYGIYAQGPNSKILGNLVYESGGAGIYSSGNYTNYTNNLVFSADGACINPHGDFNVLYNNTAYDCDLPMPQVSGAFSIIGDNNTLQFNHADNSTNGYYVEGDQNLIGNCTAYGNILGMNVLPKHGIPNVIMDGTFEESYVADFMVGGDIWLTFGFIFSGFDLPAYACNNLVENMTGSGGRPILYVNGSDSIGGGPYSEILLCNAQGATFTNVVINGSNTLNNNGFLALISNDTLVTGSNSYANFVGFWFMGSYANTVEDSTANYCRSGFGGLYGNNTIFNNCTAFNNTDPVPRLNAAFGFMSLGNNFTLVNNSKSYKNMLGVGLSAGNNFSLLNTEMYNNSYDYYASGPTNSTLNGAYFLNPYGTYENYTNFSMADTMEAGEQYSMNWTTNSTGLPFQMFSFRDKFLDITSQNATPSIDEAAWHWDESEVTSPPYNESKFELWEYSGAWAMLNNTPDTTANTLSWYNFNPASDYGILQNNVTPNCPVINESGTFTMDNDYVGAPNEIFPDLGDIPMSYACLVISASDVLFDCNGYAITNNGTDASVGIYVNGTSADGHLNNVTIRNCRLIDNYTAVGAFLHRTENSTLTNSSATNSSIGFRTYISSYNRLSGLTAYNTTLAGINVYTSYYNNVTDSVSYGDGLSTGSYGFAIQLTSYGNVLDNCTSRNNGIGFFMGRSSNNLFANSAAINSSAAGCRINNVQSVNNTIENYTAYGTNGQGIYLSLPVNTTLRNVTLHSNLQGLYMDRISGINNVFNLTTLYNNSVDFQVTTTTTTSVYYSWNMTFLNPYGTYENYTVVDMGDAVTSNENYYLNWTQTPSPLPNKTISFRQKFVTISNATSTAVSISGVLFKWDSSEEPGYNTSNFALWKYSAVGGWSALNNSPDTENRTLGWYNFNPASEYGILENDTNCPLISAPGEYTMDKHYRGAPNDASEMETDAYACVKITSSDVTFDCSGFSITGNGTLGTIQYGILLSGPLNNVTVRNCPGISNYTTGFYAYGASNSSFSEIVSHNNTQYGFRIGSGTYSNLTNSRAYGNGYEGFYLQKDSNYNLLVNNTAYDNQQNGFYLDSSSSYNRIKDSVSYGNTYDGFRLYSKASYNNVSNSTAYGNLWKGFHLDNLANYNLLYNDSAYENGEDGFAITDSSEQNTIANSISRDNDWSGFFIADTGTDSNIIANNTAYGHTDAVNFRAGFRVDNGAASNSLNNNTAHGNAIGILLVNSGSGNTFNTAILYNNGYDFAPANMGVGTFSYQATSLNILNPAGTYVDYTVLDVEDGSVAAGNVYYVQWTRNTTAIPSGTYSFRNKFVNISNHALSATPASISKVLWRWQESELTSPSYNESEFELWKYNSSDGWTMLNETPDTTANTLGWYDFDPASEYGILEHANITVTLNSPPNGYLSFDGAVSFTCSATTPNSLVNITLYGNWTGSWEPNATESLSGQSDSATFSGTFPIGSYHWNCLGFDNESNWDWGDVNFTFEIRNSTYNLSLIPMNVTVINTSKYEGNATVGQYELLGGNLTEANANLTLSTEKWAGVYGNMTVYYVLAEEADTQYMYQWDWANGSAKGEVCLTQEQNPAWGLVSPATKAQIDTVWDFDPTDSDSANNTLIDDSATLNIAGTSFPTTGTYLDAYSEFQMAAFVIGYMPENETQFAFCSNVTGAGLPNYQNKPVMFELIVPTTEGYSWGPIETYYVFAELE